MAKVIFSLHLFKRLLFCLFIGLSTINALAQDTLTLPNWEDIFDSNGARKDEVGANGSTGSNGIADYIDLYGAVDAVFAGDDISNGIGTDTSVSDETQALTDTAVRNDTVAAIDDLGNGFVMAKRGINNSLILYAGMERLAVSNGSSYIEFEFNQEVIQSLGVNSTLRGDRSTGDLLVRVTLDQGVVSGAQVKRWNSNGQFATVDSVAMIPGVDCSGDPFEFLVCDPWQASGQHNYQTGFVPWTEGWDMSGNPITPTPPNSILEFAINVGSVLGTNPDYTSIVVRSPADIILAGFRHIGHWAQLSASSN